MTGRRFRALALPALAILVPSAFIAVLASEWLSLDEEASRLRGAEAAAVALGELRQGLLAAVADAGREIRPRLAEAGGPDAAASDDPAWPALVADAFVFTSVDGAPAASDARAASAPRAAELIAAGARALAEGRLEDAEASAVEVFLCCGDARDEFGVAYITYAAWQRLAVDSRRPSASRPAAIVHDLGRAIARGQLSDTRDLVGVRLLSEKLGHVAGAASLVQQIQERAAATERRLQTMRLARSWLDSLAWNSADTGPRIGTWHGPAAATLVAGWRPAPAETVVMVLDADALKDWVSRWSDVRWSFALALSPSAAAPSAAPDTVLGAPLFVEAPGMTVAVRRGPDDPAADRRRQTLFMTAAGAVVVLTLVAGYLTARDVFRERRTAALRSAFLAGVTHEIKTPLTSIRLMAETLQQRRASPEASEALLETIVGEAEHLSSLVDNVLGTARVESGTRRYQPRVVSLPDAVRSGRRRFDYTLSKEGFTIREDIPDRDIFVNADPEALEQAVLNLLGNAAKFSGAAREIQVTVATSAAQASVSVADAGIGIPEEEQAHIFTSFYRGRGSAETTPGSGLGLALVKHFAEAHGGSVAVSSRPGAGSTFSIALPLAAPQESEHGEESDRHGLLGVWPQPH
jgi:signal transduction histidine kinase